MRPNTPWFELLYIKNCTRNLVLKTVEISYFGLFLLYGYLCGIEILFSTKCVLKERLKAG